ncbi:MAG: Ig-like domain-containing protein [Bacteroidales bacterium]|nr:Ig-like domain-containing protein [Bacteroidales bacterium]
MTHRRLQLLFPLAAVAAILLPLLLGPSCANTTQPPSGGPKDTIPPVIVDINPLPGTVNFPVKGSGIVFTFDEYFTIKESKNIFLSPPQEKPPVCKVRGKNLVVTFEAPLDSNTTYTLAMADALADNNEGNMFPGYTYVFSTGTHIDSMAVTGVVQDCNTLKPVKGATVLLHKDLSDSAVFLRRPCAAAKTDDWGFFILPHIADTLYRLYAIKDETNNNLYDPDADLIAFADSLVRPVLVVSDTLPEIKKYDMTDTLRCEARRTEHTLRLFREKPTKQFLKSSKRTADRAAYITFMAPGVWIDSLWVKGYKPREIITQMNILQDSLELWINSRKPAPDTLHLFVNYRKTDSLGRFQPFLEHVKLYYEDGRKTISQIPRRKRKHEDTTCLYKLEAKPETVEQNGISLTFDQPIIFEQFDSIQFRYRNARQKEFKGSFSVEQDSLNLRRYVIRPKDKWQVGFEYSLKLPAGCFRSIDGFLSDSTATKITLPTDDKLSTLRVKLTGVDGKLIADLLSEDRKRVLRSYIVHEDTELLFPYLQAGRYLIRLTDDKNQNSIVDTGSLLERRQPESVVFFQKNGKEYIEIPASAEVTQDVHVIELLKR